MSARSLRATAALLAMGALACTPDFDNVTTVKDLRVLAVASEPSQILIDRIDPAAPPKLPPIELSPLIVDPAGRGRPVHVDISLCAPEAATDDRGRDRGAGTFRDTVVRGRCAQEALVVGQSPPEGAVLPFSARFEPSIEKLAAATGVDLRRLAGVDLRLVAPFGFPLRFQVHVRAGDEEVFAIKRVDLHPVLVPDQRPNETPVILDLHAREDADAGASSLEPGRDRRTRALAAVVAWDEGGARSERPGARERSERTRPAFPATAAREVRLGSRLIITPVGAQPETYAAMTYDREAGRLVLLNDIKETLRFAFFASRGTFSPAQVNTEPDPIRTNAKVVMESTYEAPKRLPPGADPDVDIWVVVRDERAGQSFAHARLRLVP